MSHRGAGETLNWGSIVRRCVYYAGGEGVDISIFPWEKPKNWEIFCNVRQWSGRVKEFLPVSVFCFQG